MNVQKGVPMYKRKALDLISREHARASNLFPPFHSPHEGIAIIEEEFLELRAIIFENHTSFNDIEVNKL